MNLHAKLNRNRTKRDSKIGGTEMLKKKEEKKLIFRLDLAFFKKSQYFFQIQF